MGPLKGHEEGLVNSAVFSTDGSSVLTACDDGTAKIWNSSTGRCIQTLERHEDGVYSAVFSADGRSVLTASDDRTAKMWNS